MGEQSQHNHSLPMKQEEHFKKLFESEDFKEALKQYEESTAKGEFAYFDSEQLLDIADFYAMHEQNDKLEQTVDYGLTLHPDSDEIKLFKARLLMTKDKLLEAHMLLESISEMDEEIALVRGSLMVLQNQSEKAMEYLWNYFTDKEKSMEIQFSILLDIIELFYEYHDKNDYALQWAEFAWQLSKRRSIDDDELRQAQDYLTDLRFEAGQPDKAILILEQIIDKDPYDIHSWLRLGYIYAESGSHEEALEAYENATAIAPDNAEVNYLKAKSYEKMFRFEQACNEYTRCYESGFEQLDVAYSLGYIYHFFLKNKEFAIRFFEQARSLITEETNIEMCVAIYTNLMQAYANSEDYTNAARICNLLSKEVGVNEEVDSEDIAKIVKSIKEKSKKK